MANRHSSLSCGLTAGFLVLVAGWSGSSLAQELPVPCAGAACGANGPATWVTDGSVTGSIAGNAFNINQATQSATLNWASFNIGENGVVNFNQPDASSVAVNNIFQSDPSQIFGALNANGQVYLINQNGILFGETAQVNVGGMIASSLAITEAALEDGIVGAVRRSPASPAFAAFMDADGNPLPSGAVTVENGAFLGAEGGQIFLFAPAVTNRGTISTPGGQTILAAGDTIYLAASTLPDLRGIIVEVDGDGIATNGEAANAGRSAAELVGEIAAERGNVTIAGFAVNQLGRVSATTSVRENGTIRLVARREISASTIDQTTTLAPNEAGSIVIGENSETRVALELDSDERTVDVNEQRQSIITVDAGTIDIENNAVLSASAGRIDVTARSDPQALTRFGSVFQNFSAQPDDSRLSIGENVLIDVSGASAERSVSENIIEVELRGNQLADSPAQRDGAIRSETVLVDIRQTGVRADGSVWQGTPLADTSGEVSNIERTVAERSLTGGTVTLNSQGAVVVGAGTTVNVSGGQVEYSDGDVTTTRLLGEDGQVYDIAEADRDRNYVRLVDSFTVEHPRWGVTEVFEGFQADASGTFEAGYVEGYDAGTLAILAPQFVFDGNITAATVASRYQRNAPQAVPTSLLYRPFDELPLGGQLLVGEIESRTDPANFVLGDVEIAGGLILPELAGSAGTFDPTVDVLPDDFVSRLRPDLFGTNRVTRASLRSNGGLVVDDNVTLTLPGGAELNAVAGEILFGAAFSSPSGLLSLATTETTDIDQDGSITVTGSADVNVAGTWVNDNPTLGSSVAPLFIDGGSFSVAAAEADLIVADGSRIDVSGGAYRDADGVVTAGTAGSIALSATSTALGEPVSVSVEAELLAFALSDGGSLSISASIVCIAENDCADDPGELALPTDLFVDRGFSSIAVASNLLGIELAPNTQIALSQRNRQFSQNTSLIRSGTALATFTDIVTLPDVDRSPVDLTLTGQTTGFVGFDPTAFNSSAGLLLGEGSRIDLDARASLTLTSNSLVSLQGAVSSPAGDVTVNLTNSLVPLLDRPPAGIWVGSNARIDVSGTTLSRVDGLGRRIGTVFDGGTIAINAFRDGLALSPGSVLDISGTQADLTIRSGTANNPGFEVRTIGSNGGTLTLQAAEYILASGTIDASGSTAGTAGGDLNVLLDGGLRGTDPRGGNSEPVLSLDPRRIRLVEDTDPVTLGVGSAAPDTLIGTATLSADLLEAAGFQDITLQAETLFSTRNGTGFLASLGQIEFAEGLDLVVPGRLTLDAANIVGGGGDVRIDAASITLGHALTRDQSVGSAAASRSGSLTLSAGLIDLLGNFRISGFDSVALESAGDIRATGIFLNSITSRERLGSLSTEAALTLTAQQLYPTTQSRFAVNVGGDAGTLTILPVAGTPAPALSAGGELVLSASTIDQQGVIRAPYGSIDLIGNEVRLADGSLTSTSLDDLLIPFGTLQGGLDWTYSIGGIVTRVFDGELNAFPEQRVDLVADSISIEDGSTIDVSAGGDLLAYEFVPGIGGSTDYLSVEESPNLFAILPDLGLAYAPIDPTETAGSSLRPGDAVFLEGIEGLAAGTYTLLPARYAILPGAVLVSPVEGYTDIRPGEVFTGLDGSAIIAGRATVNGTDVLATRTQGFALLPRSRAFEEAQYSLALASQFFAESGIRTPLDAGSVTLAASDALALSGDLLAQTQRRGAALDIASERLRLVDSLTGADDFVEIVTDDLVELGAESLLLGGRRSTDAGGTRIDVVAAAIEVGSGSDLTGPELILAATEDVSVAAGARVEASGAATGSGDILIDGDAALVRVSSGEQRGIRRSNVLGADGDIVIADGAVLASTGSIAVDATRDVTSDGSLDIDGGALRLGASEIILGEDATAVGGLQLSSAALASINASELLLATPAPIRAVGSISLGISDRLLLVAPGIDAAPGAALTLMAPTIELTGADMAAPAPGAGTGTLTLSGDTLSLLGGEFAVSGTATTLAAFADGVSIAGAGGWSLSGDLTVDAGLFSLVTGADYRISATGDVAFRRRDGGSVEAGFGGRLRVAGANVSLDTSISAPSGQVALSAANDVLLGENAVIDVSGRTLAFADVSLATPGGIVELAATGGDITVASGASIDVSSPDRAGGLAVSAPAGTVDFAAAIAGGGTRGGEFSLDAQTFSNSNALLADLAASGFNGAIALRQRGAGNVTIGSGRTIRAEQIALQADQGDIVIDGDLLATGPEGREISLAARGDVTINGTVQVADNGVDDDFSQLLRISSAEGGIVTAADSLIEFGAQAELWLSVTRDVLATLTDANATSLVDLAGQIIGAGDIRFEGRQTYTVADGSIDAGDVLASPANPWFADADAFAATAPALTAALGFADDARFTLLPGVELVSDGDLTVANEFNLFNWRFGPENAGVGVLTLRAANDLLVDAPINDGFSSGVVGALTFTGDSWSYRLVAGADLMSANPLSVVADPLAGSFVLAGGTLSTNIQRSPARNNVVRTGTGRIDLAAAGDVVFENQASVLYTSGAAREDGTLLFLPGSLGRRAYPDNGGDITVYAGRDVLGAASDQLFTAWLYREGRPLDGSTPRPLAWTINFENFQQGIGALGGGNVSLVAGNDIIDMSASVPTIGLYSGPFFPPFVNDLQVIAGGNISVRAGNDLLGGAYFADDGDTRINVGGSVGASADSLAPVFGLSDSVVNVVANGDIAITAAVSPTLVQQAFIQSALANTSFYARYTDDTAITLQSVAGDIATGELDSNGINAIFGQYASLRPGAAEDVGFIVAPPNVDLVSFNGNVVIPGPMTLWPSPTGNLNVLAGNDVTFGTPALAPTIILSDVSPSLVPTPDNLVSNGFFEGTLRDVFTQPLLRLIEFNADVPVHLADTVPVRIVARDGDVRTLFPLGSSAQLNFAKPVQVTAGRDIVNLSLEVQNLTADSVTSLTAGRDILFTSDRLDEGQLSANGGAIDVAGPGFLALRAGRDIDLQTSSGISTVGDILNPALPDGGASVSLIAGLTDTVPDYAAFIERYLVDSAEYDEALIDFVNDRVGLAVNDKSAALAAFNNLDDALQAVFVETVFFAELRTSGRLAASPGEFNNDFSRGFEALETLFPGANPDIDSGEVNAYDGDIRLFFSRVYTLDGGDIRLLVPGGEINAGLATPPTAFGVDKDADELGIVAQRFGDIQGLSFSDFAVNESRVFAADGGDILIWATRGDIDAGRGAKTAISAPPPVITINSEGVTEVSFPAALTGSGIQTLATTPGVDPGNVDLFAPRGVVNAGDAGIVAGNLTIAAVAVLGADNIQVSGISVGVPTQSVPTAGLGNASSVASSAQNTAQAAAVPQGSDEESSTPLADQALGFLDVFILGFGDCNPETGEGCDDAT